MGSVVFCGGVFGEQAQFHVALDVGEAVLLQGFDEGLRGEAGFDGVPVVLPEGLGTARPVRTLVSMGRCGACSL